MAAPSRGTLNGQTNVGGIAGKNETTGTISRCANEAEVDGNRQPAALPATMKEPSVIVPIAEKSIPIRKW